MIQASCLCGGVSYEIAGPIVRPRYCHCVQCRKFSGTAAAAWALIEAGDVPPPQMHVWTRSKASWASIADDLPQHEIQP